MKLETKSSIEEIFKGLEEEGEKEKRRILAEAEEEAKGIVGDAEKRAREIYDSIIEQKRSIASGEVTKIIREAEQEAERKLADVKVRFVNHIFDLARKNILELRKTERYRQALKRLLQECLEEMGSTKPVDVADEDALAETLLNVFRGKISREEALSAARSIIQNREKSNSLLEMLKMEIAKNMPSVVITCAPEDEPVIKKILEELKIKARVVTDSSIDGGVLVNSADGKITVDNTLNSRINKLKKLYTKELVEKFFSEK